MRKEVIIAIVIGFVVGLAITFGLWTANKTFRPSEVATEEPEETAPENEISPTPTPEPVITLEISSPENNSILNKDEVNLIGKSVPGSVIAIISEKGENVVETEADGSFEETINLVNGTNEIKITAFTANGSEVSRNLNVVYTTQEI